MRHLLLSLLTFLSLVAAAQPERRFVLDELTGFYDYLNVVPRRAYPRLAPVNITSRNGPGLLSISTRVPEGFGTKLSDSISYAYSNGRKGDLNSKYLPFDTMILWKWYGNGGYFQPFYRETQVFDQSSSKVTKIAQDYDRGNNQWLSQLLETETYFDATGNDTLSLTYWLDSPNAFKIVGALTRTAFDWQHLPASYERWWFSSPNDTLDGLRERYIYDGKGILNAVMSDRWEPKLGTWIAQYEQRYQTNQDGLLTHTSTVSYDPITGSQYIQDVRDFFYDSQGCLMGSSHQGTPEIEVRTYSPQGLPEALYFQNSLAFFIEYNSDSTISSVANILGGTIIVDTIIKKYFYNVWGQLDRISQYTLLNGVPSYYYYSDGICSYRYDASTRIADAPRLPTAEVFPNPASDQITIQFREGNAFDIVVQFINIEGKMVYERNFLAGSGNTHKASVQHLPDGLYFLVIKNGTEVLPGKTIVVSH